MRSRMKVVCLLFFLSAITLFSGCTSALRNEQLEKVAKDWSLVIRASQVIPVYPLTEDLQPGDVLLVRTPIDEQAAQYKEKGFLPLDQHLIRLYSKDYYEFYKSRYGITGENVIPPSQWQAMSGSKHNWGIAPHAAFPTYQFSVKTGSGLNLAIPIQGIPFALGLMNSGSASGTVTIADAYTYGLDIYHLKTMVDNWAKNNRRNLRTYEPTPDGKYHFLRVIARVYVTGRVNVTLNNDEATSAEAGAGADQPVTLMGIKKDATAENYNTAITAINNLLQTQAPGIKAKIATASSRSVTLDQPFDKPLVIGYVGFDMPILKGGRLGAPISTLSQLTKTSTLQSKQTDDAYIYRLAALSHINAALKKLAVSGNADAKNVIDNLNKLSRLLPDAYPFAVYHQPLPNSIELAQKTGDPVDKKRGFDEVADYMGNADSSRNAIANYLRTGADAQKNEYRQELQKTESAIKELEDRLQNEPALMEAIDFIFFEN